MLPKVSFGDIIWSWKKVLQLIIDCNIVKVAIILYRDTGIVIISYRGVSGDSHPFQSKWYCNLWGFEDTSLCVLSLHTCQHGYFTCLFQWWGWIQHVHCIYALILHHTHTVYILFVNLSITLKYIGLLMFCLCTRTLSDLNVCRCLWNK